MESAQLIDARAIGRAMTGPHDAIELMRREKDEAFRADPNSPIPDHERPRFKGLRYYPVDPAWRFEAQLVPNPKRPEVVMQTSDGAQKRYLNVGHFDLKTPSGDLRIQAYQGPGHGLFIPFRDSTSGKETYGAGRYLDIHHAAPVEPHVLDFNLAYNPFCAYNDAFSCPFPPTANWLQLPIPAGEKTYKDA